MKTKLNKEVVTDKSNDKGILTLNVVRENGKTILKLKTALEIEKLFKNEETEQSEVYKADGDGLVYYKVNDLKTELNFPKCFTLTKFGSALFWDYNTLNFSILRTKGISNGISFETTDLISEERLTEWATELKNFVVVLYKLLVRPIEINVFLEKKEIV